MVYNKKRSNVLVSTVKFFTRFAFSFFFFETTCIAHNADAKKKKEKGAMNGFPALVSLLQKHKISKKAKVDLSKLPPCQASFKPHAEWETTDLV